MITVRILPFLSFFIMSNIEALFVDISYSEPTKQCCGLFSKKPKKILLQSFFSQNGVNYEADGFFVKNEDENSYRFLLKNGGELVLRASWKEHVFAFVFSTNGFILSPHYIPCTVQLNENEDARRALIDLSAKTIVCVEDRRKLFKILDQTTKEELVFNLLPACESQRRYRLDLDNTDTYRL